MEQRQFIPEYFSADRRDALIWFLDNFEIQYLSCSLWRSENPWYIAPRRIMDNFFLFPIAPLLAGADGEEERIIAPGEFFLAPTGRRHWFGLPEGLPACEHIILHYSFPSRLRFNPVEAFPSVFHPLPDYGQWYEKFRRLICLSSHHPRATENMGNALMRELMQELFLQASPSLTIPRSKTDPRIERVIRYLEDNFRYDIMIPDLVEKTGLREVQFRKLFHRHTGMSAKEYLVQCRMRRATDLLRSTTESVRKIAIDAGFNNAYYFSAVFKRYTGIAPSQYRQKLLV